ncbi:MAG: diguanylate cyclase, partial [Pygmaiobacter sp.]
ENKEFADLPILVMTQSEEDDTELRALELGATDFLNKPYKPAILLQRLYNILAMHESIALRNTLERDELTGVYNRSTFNRKAQALLEDHPEEMFEVLGINVERFKLVNEIFGNKEGDRL